MRLDGSISACPPKDRIGTPHVLPYSVSQFRTLFRIQARHAEHSGLLELRALVILVRRLARSPSGQNVRYLILVDAKAVLCAAAKGRSNRAFNRLLRELASLYLCSNCLVRLLYVPSQHNPADWPSRGDLLPSLFARGDVPAASA